MKKTDYQIKKGNEKIKFVRGVKINDKDTNLTVEITLNHNKGLYTIAPKITTSEVTDDEVLDKATCKVMADLLYEAMQYCIKWRKKIKENDDAEQLPLGFD